MEFCPRNRGNHTFHHQLKIFEKYENLLVDRDQEHNITIKIDKLKTFYFM
jgi:hypothetical protein